MTDIKDQIAKHIPKSEPAGLFAPHVEVWSEMGVRIAVINATEEKDKRIAELKERGMWELAHEANLHHDTLTENYRLKAQLDDRHKRMDKLHKSNADLLSAVDEMDYVKDLKSKLDAVRPYIRHKLGCGTSIVECIEWGVEPKCTCGLQQALGEESFTLELKGNKDVITGS